MIKTTVKLFDRFEQITARVERAAVEGLDAAARTAAETAQANSKHGLEIEVKRAAGDVEGFTSGIRSRRLTDVEGRTTPIARFFDEGTLGKRKKRTKRPRKTSWTVTKKATGNSYVANRRELDPEKGIEAEHFFPKARAAGRRKLLERINEELS